MIIAIIYGVILIHAQILKAEPLITWTFTLLSCLFFTLATIQKYKEPKQEKKHQ